MDEILKRRTRILKYIENSKESNKSSKEIYEITKSRLVRFLMITSAMFAYFEVRLVNIADNIELINLSKNYEKKKNSQNRNSKSN